MLLKLLFLHSFSKENKSGSIPIVDKENVVYTSGLRKGTEGFDFNCTQIVVRFVGKILFSVSEGSTVP